MPFWRLYYHLVWATKNREHLIVPGVKDPLYRYIRHKAAEMGVHVLAVGGWFDHVHLLVSVPPRHALADVVGRLKGASAHEMNRIDILDCHFSWQRGYGALGCGQKQKSTAIAYIENQERHHKQQTTNSWLEHYAASDEGPERADLVAEKPSISEESVEYSLEGDFPF